MEMERIISIGGRLQKILEDADTEAQKKISEAKRKADEAINSAKAEADYRRGRAERGTGIDDLIVAEEKKAKKEAEKIAEEYQKKVDELTYIPDKKIEESVDLVLKEVLPR
jgi:vacuolar-type H+-ATPase subunit H